jgi:hypothetical protein
LGESDALTAFKIKGFWSGGNGGNLDLETEIGIGIQKGILSEIQI